MPALTLALLLATPQAPAAACPPVPGVTLVTDAARPGRFVVMGEMHGTVQAPRLFGTLVCHAVRSHPVNVHLELRADAQPALDAFMASDGSVAARDAFLAHELWDARYADGRNSQAVFDLIDALRRLKQAGSPVMVFATQPTERVLHPQAYYELAMAQGWARIAARAPKATNLILVGSAHARLGDAAGLGFTPAAAHFPPGDVVVLGPLQEGGASWSMRIGPDGKPALGSRPLSGKPARAGIAAATDTARGVNATYAFGEPARASPPRRR